MKNNKAYSLLIGLLAFTIFVFFTTNIYSNYSENLELKNQKEKKLEELDKELKELNSIKQDKLNLEIVKFLQEFNEAEIFNYINKYIEEINQANREVVMEFGQISFSEPKKSEIGFKQIDINLNLKNVRDVNDLKAILDYLTSKNSKYSFFITKFSFPIEKTGPYKTINIPLTMFIK